jgi:Domain of unknown function (DUF4136)
MMSAVALYLVMASAAVATDTKPEHTVEYDARVDFSRYQSWEWRRRHTPAPNLVTNKRLQEAIERGLAARGLHHVEKGGGLLVTYHATGETRIEIGKLGYPTPDFPGATGIRYLRVGSVLIAMIDAATGKVVWRGTVTDVMNYGPAEIEAQVVRAMDALLADFPPTRPH